MDEKRALKRLSTTHGDLHGLIPAMVNQFGQHETAKRLGVSAFTINRWLKVNKYKRVVRYEREAEAS